MIRTVSATRLYWNYFSCVMKSSFTIDLFGLIEEMILMVLMIMMMSMALEERNENGNGFFYPK